MMADIVFVAIVVVFFILAVALVRVCERLLGTGSDSTGGS
jgi:hypothetical protein